MLTGSKEELWFIILFQNGFEYSFGGLQGARLEDDADLKEHFVDNMSLVSISTFQKDPEQTGSPHAKSRMAHEERHVQCM